MCNKKVIFVPNQLINLTIMKKLFTFIFTLAFVGSVMGQNLIQDPGFEAGTPSTAWTEASTNFGTPLCDQATCGNCGGPCVPHNGQWFAWFGGAGGAVETGSLIQSVTIPNSTSATLKFWYKTPYTAANTNDYFKVFMDGNVIWSSTNADSSTYKNAYVEVSVNVASYANGQSHTLKFEGYESGSGTTNMLLDDITLSVQAGLYTNYLDEGITVYPNPTSDFLNIEFARQASNDLVVYLYDVNGKLVFEQIRQDAKMSVDLRNFAKGTYFLRIGNDKVNVVAKRIVVE